MQVVSWDNIDQQSSTMIQNNQAPDILNLNAYASYAKDGLLYNSDEVLPAAAKSDILDTFVKYGTYQGKFYGFPDLSSARAFFYNKTLFKQAGIAKPPKTWAELEADAKKITALGNGNVGYALPLGPEESQGEFSMWLFNNGGDWKTDGKWVINSDKNVQTLTFMKKLADEKVTQNNPARTNRADAFDLFKSGKAGMVVGFSPLAGALDADKKVDYGVAPFPSNDDTESKTFGVTDYLMAFKKPGNQAAVKAFYDLYYQPDQVNTFIKAEGFLPVTKTGVQQFSSDPKLKVYLDTLPNAKLTPTDDPTWDKVKLAVQQNLGGAMTGSPRPPSTPCRRPPKTAAEAYHPDDREHHGEPRPRHDGGGGAGPFPYAVTRGPSSPGRPHRPGPPPRRAALARAGARAHPRRRPLPGDQALRRLAR